MNVLIAGGGRVGAYLAALLAGREHTVRLVEITPAEAERVRAVLPDGAVTCGDATDPKVLEAAGVRSADVLAAVTGQDDTNLVVAGIARSVFQTPKTMARIIDPAAAWMFTPEMGVDVGLGEADLMARIIADEMTLSDVSAVLKLRLGQYLVVEKQVAPGSPVAGRCVRDFDWPGNCVLIAIIRAGQLIVPRGGTQFDAGDQVLALVNSADVGEFGEVFDGP